jgi:hypothetical protein
LVLLYALTLPCVSTCFAIGVLAMQHAFNTVAVLSMCWCSGPCCFPLARQLACCCCCAVICWTLQCMVAAHCAGTRLFALCAWHGGAAIGCCCLMAGDSWLLHMHYCCHPYAERLAVHSVCRRSPLWPSSCCVLPHFGMCYVLLGTSARCKACSAWLAHVCWMFVFLNWAGHQVAGPKSALSRARAV